MAESHPAGEADKLIQTVIVTSTEGDDDNGRERVGSLISEMLIVSNTPESKESRRDQELGLDFNTLSLETKYYSAAVQLVPMHVPNLISELFSQTVQAIIIHTDPAAGGGGRSPAESLLRIKAWAPFLDEFEPSVKILCGPPRRTTTQQGIDGDEEELQKWIISNGFEYVPLVPEDESSTPGPKETRTSSESSDDEEAEDEDKDITGVKYILKALHAHIWPAMDLKDRPAYRPSERFEALMREEIAADISRGEHERTTTTTTTNDSENDQRQEVHNNGEDFESLFSKLIDFKEKANSLEGDARREYAEKVAVAFYKAIGQDDDDDDDQQQ